MRQKIQKRSRFSSIQLMIKKTLKIVPKLSCQLDRNKWSNGVRYLYEQNQFLFHVAPRRVARFTYSAECTLKSKVKFEVGLHTKLVWTSFDLTLLPLAKIRYSGSTRGFKTSILPSYFSAKSFFLFGIVSQRVGAHCYTGTIGWHHFWSSKFFIALRHISWYILCT